MADKPPQCRPHTDLRHRSQIPLPAIEAVERHVTELLGPSVLAPRSLERRDPRQPQRLLRMRQRLLTLPVMVARMGRLVWRRMPAVAEVQQVLAREGLWWAPPLRVSLRAIPKRLAALPAAALGPLFMAICTRLQAQAPTVLPQPSGAPVRAPFSPVAMGDGATLEARRHKTPAWREREGWGLAGKSVGLVEAFSPYPRWPLYTEDAAATDQRVAAERLAAVPAGALGVFALGFCSLLWCDDCTAANRFFITRLREKTAYRTVHELSRGMAYRDAIIPVGQYRSTPCQHPVRMVSVWWQGVWDRDLTTVVASPLLSARQECELYRRRWRIEDAVALTKRRVDLADLWTGSTNGVQRQIDATLIFYAVLLMVCQQVAQALSEPLERIAVEMVFRACYHSSRAVPHGACNELMAFLAEQVRLLGLVKRRRKQHRERQELEAIIWDDS